MTAAPPAPARPPVDLRTGASVEALLEGWSAAASDRERWQYLRALAEIRPPEAVPVMIASLQSSSSAIVALAAQFLGEADDERAILPMLQMLAEPPPDMSLIWVIAALGRLGNPRVVPALIRFLHTTRSAPERYTTIEILGRMGCAEAIGHIARYAGDPDHHVRDRVVVALESLRSAARDSLN